MISLENLLSKFKPHKNVEYEGRKFMTNVPAVGELAYLNIIYDAADDEIQRDIIDPLRLPTDLRDFYRTYNGAHLFSNLLRLYGFRPKSYLFDRDNRWRALPYDLIDTNAEFFKDWQSSGIILVGSYGYDRSEVYVERSTGLVHCSVADNLRRIRASWVSFETWLEEEIGRLSECFDENGNRLVEIEETLPTRGYM